MNAVWLWLAVALAALVLIVVNLAAFAAMVWTVAAAVKWVIE